MADRDNTASATSAPREPHKTRPVQVWVDVDVGIADLVEYLNTIPGVRTLYSCQGTLGEGGPHPYGPYVGVSWESDEVEARLRMEFDLTPPTDDPEWDWSKRWGHLHPRNPSGPPMMTGVPGGTHDTTRDRGPPGSTPALP